MVGLPHSEILGSKLIRSSPGLIAAYYVLHRLHAPRHPLDALMALDRSHYLYPQRPRPLLKAVWSSGKNERPRLATWSFDRSDQKKPEFTCCRCLSPRVWDQTSSEASLYDVERSGSVTPYKDASSQTCSLTMRRLGYWGTGGAGRNRTDDILLAKQALSQLSYGPMPFPEEWWARVDSNYRPHAYQACALTT